MLDESLLARLDLLDQYVRDLRGTQPPSFAAYESNKTPALQRTHDGATSCCASHDVKDAPSGASVLRRYTERMMHMTIDACIQIGIAVLTQEGMRNPENYHDIFIVLGEHGILPRRSVDCMTALVEFRNLLVYEPGSVDDMMVYGFAKKRVNDFTDFESAVREYLAPRLATHSRQTEPARDWE
ncbi:MAG: DUF86 domain-containing protein, partial [Chloroflexota bacterium]|nr:DUF86 domain-containing protein [Chloroflexota bacterium]